MTELDRVKTTLGEEFAAFYEIIAAQVQGLGLAPDARILDVGTGKGRAAISLALCGYRVLTGEPADDHSGYAKQAWQEDAEKVGVQDAITYQPFDAEALPFEAAAFDAVLMLGALHHMGDPAAAIREGLRVLAPGGPLCIMEPNATLVARARTRFPDHPEPVDPTPLVADAPLQTGHTELFDTYVVRKPG